MKQHSSNTISPYFSFGLVQHVSHYATEILPLADYLSYNYFFCINYGYLGLLYLKKIAN